MGTLDCLDGVDGFDAQDPTFHEGPTVGPRSAAQGNVGGGSGSGDRAGLWRMAKFEGGEVLVQSGGHG